MANSTITKMPDLWASYNSLSGWSGWNNLQVGQEQTLQLNAALVAYETLPQVDSAVYSAASLSVNVRSYGASMLRCRIYSRDPRLSGELEVPVATQTFAVQESGSHDFEFRSISANGPAIYFVLDVPPAPSGSSYRVVGVSCTGSSITYSLPTLSVSVTPSTTYAGSLRTVSVHFTNRLERTLTMSLSANATELPPTRRIVTDDVELACPLSWFDEAGVSGNSMSVTIRVTDDLGRSATATFTVQRPVGSDASPITPRSGSLEGSEPITFAWEVDGDTGEGYLQSDAELQWSLDNTAFEALATIRNWEQTWEAKALSFPAGTVYWRVRVKNHFAIWGPWSNSVSFTVFYAAQSQVVPVNSPISGTIIAAQPQRFQVSLEASGAVYEPFSISSATFYWRAGESGAYTAVPMTPSGDTANVEIPADTFPSGSIQWYATATDNTDRTTSTVVFTLSTLQAEVEASPVAPINTVENGAGKIRLAWRVLSADGRPGSRARLKTSQNLQTWSEITLSNLSRTDDGIYSATFTENFFAAGTVWWAVQGTNQAGTWGPYSEVVSFRVLAAARVSAVSADGKPFLTVSWQTEGQLAYEIRIDDRLYGPYRNESARSFTVQEPLEDGLHTVAVRVQNQYSLWSEWSTAQTSVSNVPGMDVLVVQAADPGTGGPLEIPGSAVLGIYGDSPHIILEQPRDLQTRDTALAQMSVTFTSGNSYFGYLEKREANSDAWEFVWLFSGELTVAQDITITVNFIDILEHHALSSFDGDYFRFVIESELGNTVSREAVFLYDEPYKLGPALRGFFPPPTGYFLVYRDGSLIGKTYRGTFTDRTAPAGDHEYHVLQVLPGGYYTRSNSVTIPTTVKCPMIAPLEGGDFIELTLSDSTNRTQVITRGSEVVYMQYAGARYPEAEIGEAETLTASGDVSYTDAQAAEARAFEALLKTPVIYKATSGEVVVGVLQGYTKSKPRFYRSYTFEISQMEWRDYSDA